jgi:hypothetical protein
MVMNHLHGGLNPELYKGIDLGNIPEKVTLLVQVTMNRQTDSFQQANGRSIIANLMSSEGLISWIEVDTEHSEFKALGVSPEDYSYLSPSIMAGLPKVLNQLGPEQAKTGAGLPVNFTDDDNDTLNDAMEAYASKYQFRSVTLKVKVDGLFTLQVLTTNGIPTPTLIARGWEIVGIYHPPSISAVAMGDQTMSFAQGQAMVGRKQGILRNTALGVTGSNLSKFGAGTPAAGQTLTGGKKEGSSMNKPATRGAFVKPATSVQPIGTAAPSAAADAIEVDAVVLPAPPVA